jgi:hypothetical protein
MLDTPAETLFRSPDFPLRAGNQVSLDGLKARVIADDGKGPTRVEFTLDRSWDDPSVRLMIWENPVGFMRIAPPTIGESLIVPSQ